MNLFSTTKQANRDETERVVTEGRREGDQAIKASLSLEELVHSECSVGHATVTTPARKKQNITNQSWVNHLEASDRCVAALLRARPLLGDSVCN